MPAKTKEAPTVEPVDAIRESVSAPIVPICAASRQAAAAPAKSAPRLLSELVEPVDFEKYDEEFWAHSVLSDEIRGDAYHLAYGQLKREMKVVYEDADIHDVLLLTKALKYWRKFHGKDRIQAGHLMSSILMTMGFTHRNPIRLENDKKGTARWEAAQRLKAAGIEFIDDGKQVRKEEWKAERKEDKRLRKLHAAAMAEKKTP